MKTSDEVRRLGLYASHCCNAELIFDNDDCFCRCPRCERRCEWELVDELISWTQFEHVEEEQAA